MGVGLRKQTRLPGSGCERYTSLAMFDNFQAQDRWSKKDVHCQYQALIVAIATRHADAVDIKFLADGKPVWMALPHRAWEEYQRRTGKVITDSLAIQIAGHYLKSAIETGEHTGQEMYSLTMAETLQHLDAALEELLAPAKA
jgi:hypothetical protein